MVENIKMKRVNVLIQILKTPEIILQGYALHQELGQKRIAFFTMQKLPAEAEVRITYTYHGEQITYQVIMTQLHEQISSGRIMTSIPDENNPFPALKFYRCFAQVLSVEKLEKTPEKTGPDLKIVETSDALSDLIVPDLIGDAA